MKIEEQYLKDLAQSYIENAKNDEYFSELFAGVSYEVDCIELSGKDE